VLATSIEPIELLSQMFYPDGALGLYATQSTLQHPDWTVYDLLVDRSDLRRFVDWVNGGATKREQYRPEPFLALPTYLLAGIKVFWADKGIEPSGIILQKGREIAIVSISDVVHPMRLMRVVRHLVSRFAQNDNQIGFHASCFEYDGKAFLAVGDSGAGKSTLSIAAPLFLRGSWIGNDRIFVDLSSPELQCYAYPLPLSFNKGSLLALGLENEYTAWNLRVPPPDAASDWMQYCGDTKLKMTPLEVATNLRLPVRANAPLGGIIFPRVEFGGDNVGLSRVSIDEFRETLYRNFVGFQGDFWGDDYLDVLQHPRPDGSMFADFLDRMGDRPVFSCVMSQYRHTRLVMDQFEAASESERST